MHSSSGSAAAGTQQMPVHKLITFYAEVQHPAYSNRRYSLAVKDFVCEAVLAYECGITEGDLLRQVGPALEQQRAAAQQLTSPNLARSLQDFSEQGFMQCVLLVWATLELSPSKVRRWSLSPAMSDESLGLWRGFTAMIVNAYFERRVAWYPLDRLQMELSAVQGSSPSTEVVAEWARITYTTLEHVYPQFPVED